MPYLSSLAPHIKRNIPFNLARRICTILDKEETLQKRTEELQENLCNQGYPRVSMDINQGYPRVSTPKY